jgi:hypothetical protein
MKAPEDRIPLRARAAESMASHRAGYAFTMIRADVLYARLSCR